MDRVRVIRDHKRQLAQRLLRDADERADYLHARPSLTPDQWRLIALWLLEDSCPIQSASPLTQDAWRRIDPPSA
jgi:hypothetical protein